MLTPQNSAQEQMLAARTFGQKASQLFTDTRLTKDLTERLKILRKATAKITAAAQLRELALQIQLEEIREKKRKF